MSLKTLIETLTLSRESLKKKRVREEAVKKEQLRQNLESSLAFVGKQKIRRKSKHNKVEQLKDRLKKLSEFVDPMELDTVRALKEWNESVKKAKDIERKRMEKMLIGGKPDESKEKTYSQIKRDQKAPEPILIGGDHGLAEPELSIHKIREFNPMFTRDRLATEGETLESISKKSLETRYLLVQGLCQWDNLQLEPLEISLYTSEPIIKGNGLLTPPTSILEDTKILEFPIYNMKKNGLPLTLSISIPEKYRLILSNNKAIFQNDLADLGFLTTVPLIFHREGKFPNNSETKRVVLDLSKDADYLKFIKVLEIYVSYLNSFGDRLHDSIEEWENNINVSAVEDSRIHVFTSSVSTVSGSTGGVASAVWDAEPSNIKMWG